MARTAVLAVLLAASGGVTAPTARVQAAGVTVIVEHTCTEAQLAQDLQLAPQVDVQLSCTPAQGQTNVTIPFAQTYVLPLVSLTEATSDTIELAADAPATVTLSGGDATPLFDIPLYFATPALPPLALTLRGLTLSGGTSSQNGGAIVNDGMLTIEDSTLSGDRAVGAEGGAIFNGAGASLAVTNTLFLNNSADGNGQFSPLGYRGGAIFNGGTMMVTGSTFTGNHADHGLGGAIYNAGTATLLDSTLSANHADTASGDQISSAGGAIFDNAGATLSVMTSTLSANHADGGFGGALMNLSYFTAQAMAAITDSTLSANHADGGFGGAIDNFAALTLTNSTLVGNHANGLAGAAGLGGAVANEGGTLTIEASTLSGNHADNGGQNGAISNVAALTLTASIVAGDTASTTPEINTFTDGGYNLVGGIGVTPDTAATAGLSTNPDGSPALAANGGPTLTVALNTALSPNPAIARVPCALTTPADQRGSARPGAGKTLCDIGAFESSAAAPTPTATSTPTPSSTSTPTPTDTPTDTPTETSTSTPTDTPTETSTLTATPTLTATSTLTPTSTGVPVATPTATARPTPMLLPNVATTASGRHVVVTGLRFGPRETVAVYWDAPGTHPLATPLTSLRGIFTTFVVVPAAAPGTHTLLGIGLRSGLVARARLTIVPTPTMTPHHAVPRQL